jgi:hypothetical protein
MLKTKMGTTLTLTEIKSFVTLFHTSPQKFTHKDLYKYKTTAEIKKQFKSAESKMSKKEMKLFGCEIVKETDDYKILEILTYQASKIYGSNTRWCTTSSKEHFTTYNKNWIIYYCILKNPNTLDSAFRTRFHKVAIIVRKRNCEAICYDAIDERRGTDMVKRITEFDFFKICKEDANKKRAIYVILDHINHLKTSIKKLNVSKSNLDLINQLTKNLKSGKI